MQLQVKTGLFIFKMYMRVAESHIYSLCTGKNGWPIIGVNKEGNDYGEPVMEYTKAKCR